MRFGSFIILVVFPLRIFTQENSQQAANVVCPLKTSRFYVDPQRNFLGHFETLIDVTIQTSLLDHPEIIWAMDIPVNISSQNQSLPTYFPGMECRLVLHARSHEKKVHLTILESNLEEPIFTDCLDYISIRDGILFYRNFLQPNFLGGQPTSKELIRWCGSERPLGITSQNDALYLEFQSDDTIEKRGFRIMFEEICMFFFLLF